MADMDIETLGKAVQELNDLDRQIKALEGQKAQKKQQLAEAAVKMGKNSQTEGIAKMALDVARW